MVARTAASKAGKAALARDAVKRGGRSAMIRLEGAAIAMEEARRAGLLDGGRTEHVSFRAPKALIDAAKRESGASRLTELGLLALAMLAQPDPTSKFLKETRESWERTTRLTVDLAASLRRIKPEWQRAQLEPRPPQALVAAVDIADEGRAVIVLDTNVYIRSAAGTLPMAAARLVDRGLLFHCSVCVAELTTGVANADPSYPTWRKLRDHYASLIATFPAGRLLTPDPDIWAEAGLIAGTLARTQNFQRHQRKECLNDALIFLTAAKAGLPLLTANRDEFDLIQQLAPHGRFVHF